MDRLTSFYVQSSDGTALFVREWLPGGSPRAMVQIAHGMAEHGGRYEGLASELAARGYGVVAHDHRGHGKTAAGDFGYFSDKQGWTRCMDDLWMLNRHMADEHPGVPVILLGHSMGAFMAQQFANEHSDVLAGLVLSGSDGRPSLLAKTGRLVARVERLRLGPRGKSKLLQALSIGAFNKQFAPNRTAFDWLTREEAAVDSYLADPLCGFVPTVQFWIDLLDALPEIARPVRQAQIPKELPILMITGQEDPVSAHGKGVDRLITAYRKAGLQKVTAHFYPSARHEMFHETNRAEAISDLLSWLDDVTSAVTAKQQAPTSLR